jgi:chromatin remodeling complex protein RSC6
MVRWHWKDPAQLAVQTQEPKMKVSPQLKAMVGLTKIEAVEFTI